MAKKENMKKEQLENIIKTGIEASPFLSRFMSYKPQEDEKTIKISLGDDYFIEYDKEKKDFTIAGCFYRYEVNLSVEQARKVHDFIEFIIIVGGFMK